MSCILPILFTISILLSSCSHTGELPGPTADHRTLLPNGWIISPAGKQIPAGDFPMNMAVSPDGRFAVVSNNGESVQTLDVLDISRGTVIQSMPIDKSWLGIRFFEQGRRLAVSGGNNNRVELYSFENGRLEIFDSILLGKSWPDERIWTAGIDIDDRSGTLYVTGRESKRCYVVSLASRSVRRSIPFDAKPYTVLASRVRPWIYVSLWGGASVAIVDTASAEVIATVPVGEHPNDMAESRDGKRLFVANGNENSVSVIDVDERRVTEKLRTSLDEGPPEGSTPNALTLSSDGATLYVANADNNMLAVFDISRPGASAAAGFIPTGWYPTAVRVVPSDGTLIVANGKGGGSRANPNGPNAYHPPKHEEYIGNLLKGSVSVVPSPSREQLADYSRAVRRNTPLAGRYTATPEELAVITTDTVHRSPINHVFFIIKENRTYDQVFGDMKEGNGDPSLCLFGEEVTPNHHALARQFVLLDNFYCDAEVSADGHNWMMGAYATDYTEKTWPTQYGGRGGEYEYEGGTPIVYPSQGYLWDNCARHGVTYRSYGEFAEPGKKPTDSARAAMPSLVGHVAPFYPPWDLSISDVDRVEQWKKEFDAFVEAGTVPQFQVIKLPNDHTSGTARGRLTPKAFVAQNDLAVGRVVDHITHSPLWATSAIFLVEDDAQNGPDHVDAHRTVALVMSPYVKHGTVDHTLYSQSSMVGTIERILGLPPLSQYDAAAYPMAGSFTPAPDLTPFDARPARFDIHEKNLAGAYGQEESERMDFTFQDRAPSGPLNDIIWRSVRGEQPTFVRVCNAFIKELKSDDEDDD